MTTTDTRGATKQRPTDNAGHNYTQDKPPTPEHTPTSRNPLTSTNTNTPTSDSRTLEDRTGVPVPRAPGDDDLAGFVPGGRTARRVLFAGSAHWSFPGKVVFELNRWRFLLGYRHATLVVGRKCGLDDTVAHLWSRTGTVERVDDLLAAVPQVDGVMAFLAELDPVVLEVWDAAVQCGVPCALEHYGRFPWPAGSVERERSDAAGPREPAARWRRRA